MQVVNNRIIVKVDMAQKNTMLIGDLILSTATKFEVNYREKSPVIAEVVTGNSRLKKGDIILCHHNHFYSPSPYELSDGLFSIPFNKTIFALIKGSGQLMAICGNVLGERVSKTSFLDVPVEFREKHIDRLHITDRGWSTFKNGTTVICKQNAPYDIVYNIGGIEKRVTKVSEDMIIGLLQNK